MYLRRIPESSLWGPEPIGGQANADFAELHAFSAHFDGAANGNVPVSAGGSAEEFTDLRGVPDAAAQRGQAFFAKLHTDGLIAEALGA